MWLWRPKVQAPGTPPLRLLFPPPSNHQLLTMTPTAQSHCAGKQCRRSRQSAEVSQVAALAGRWCLYDSLGRLAPGCLGWVGLCSICLHPGGAGWPRAPYSFLPAGRDASTPLFPFSIGRNQHPHFVICRDYLCSSKVAPISW